MAERYDVVVVGVGGMGSAALYHLARRGKRVLGIERFEVPNAMGSSHGLTRIIRLAHFESPSYVPLVRRAYQLWRELEIEAGEQLLHVTGAVDAGGEVYEGSLRSCLDFDLPHELMDGRELGRRFPAYRLPDDLPVLLQPDGGFVLPERCVVAHADAAVVFGAVVRTGERVLAWDDTGDHVVVRTERGAVEAEHVVLTAGAWSQEVARLPPGLVTAERQVLAWFEPLLPELFALGAFPVFNLVLDGEHVYGFPVFGVPGFKVGRYDRGGQRAVDPDLLPRDPTREDENALRRLVERCFPAGAGPTLMLKTCPFEPSPDEDFILDHHPESRRAVVAAGFSGRGFKFCSVVGEIIADLALDGATRHDIGLFRLARFSEPGGRPSAQKCNT
jgi:sarcosine oxidase